MSSLDTTLVAGRYDAYKRATQRFLKWLRSAVPRLKIPPVRSIVDAAREFAARGEPAPASIIKDLEKCIAVRTAVHELYTAHAVVESASDRGHGYFVQVLKCVRRLLRTSEPTPSQPQAVSVEPDTPDANLFAALTVDDAGGVEESKDGTAELPAEPRGAATVDIMGESESFAAMCFLLDVEAAQKEVVAAWAAFRDERSTILEATALTNALVRHVDALAVGLALEHPAIVTFENAIAAASLRVEESTATGDDFLSGSSGLLVTSNLVRSLAERGALRESSDFLALPGEFGRQWHEASNPAASINDLRGYAAGVLPALVWAAGSGHTAEFLGQNKNVGPHAAIIKGLHVDACMPLWPLLRKQIGRTGAHSTLPAGLIFALHAMLLSVVVVNGDGRCNCVGVDLIAYLSELMRCIETLGKIIMQNDIEAAAQLAPTSLWLMKIYNRLTATPESIPFCDRDDALLFNPWVAGQQTLAVAMGLGIECSVRVAYCSLNTPAVLHTYNALLKAGLIKTSDTAEALLQVFDGKLLWIGGRRAERRFGRAFAHSMGASAFDPTKWRKNECDVSLADVSPVFRCVVDGNYGEGATEINTILAATREAFATDRVLGANVLHAFGAFEGLIDNLVEVMRLPDTWSAISDSYTRRYEKLTKLVNRILCPCDWLVDPYALTSDAVTFGGTDVMRRSHNMAARGEFSGESNRDFILTKMGGSKHKTIARLLKNCFAEIPADPVTRLRGGELLGARAPRLEETANQAPPPMAVTRTPSERAAAEAAARDSFAVELPSPAPSRARKGKKKSGKKTRKR